MKTCSCGNVITRPHAQWCDACRKEKYSHGGRPYGSKNRRSERVSKETKQPTVLVKARCPKCQTGRDIHYINLKRDPGYIVPEFCRNHRGLRFIDYIPVHSLPFADRFA